MNPIRHTQSFLFAGPIMLLMGLIAIWASPPFALDGVVQIHDPSTIMQCDGKYYTYGTGSGALVSDDGWTWRRGVTRVCGRLWQRSGPRRHPHRRPLLPVYLAAARMIWSKTLDPDSPDYKWEDGGIVASKEGPDDFMNPIDPGAPSGSRREAVAHLRFLFRLYPCRPARPQDRQTRRSERQARKHRDQLRSVGIDLSRRLVLPAGHSRQLLSRRRLRLQHPRRPRKKTYRPVP